MDRTEAHKFLGLYLGASNAQIDAKLAELEAEARTQLSGDSLQVRVGALRAARDTALGKPTIVMVAPQKPRGRVRGPIVLLMIVTALGVCVGLFFASAWYLDKQQARRVTGEQQVTVKAAHDAWHSYMASAGIGQTPDGERADAVLAGANQLYDAGDYTNAADDFAIALQLYNSALRAEDGRITGAWQRDVLDYRSAKLAGRFPFDPEAEAEAEADDVARLLNPNSGALWAITREYDALAAIELDGRHFATPLKSREELEVHGRAIRSALFGDHSPTIDIKFDLRITCPKALAELRLEFGGANCSSRKEGMQQAHWTQSTGGIKLIRDAKGGDVKDATLDQSGSDWGILRLISFGTPSTSDTGDMMWEFSQDAITGRKTIGKDATLHIRPVDKRNPFDLSIYVAFVK